MTKDSPQEVQIKENFRQDVEVKKRHQLLEIQKQLEVVKGSKERFVTAYTLWKREEVELKRLTKDSKDLSIDLRAYVAKKELMVQERKALDVSRKLVNYNWNYSILKYRTNSRIFR